MRRLQRGMSGPDVSEWQVFLIAQELLAPGTNDGIFGPKTDAATRAFQAEVGITVDGIVGPNTVAKAEILGFRPALNRLDRVPIPPGINDGLTMVTQGTMLDLLGVPGQRSANCSPVTNARVRRLIVTRDMGHFEVTGLRPAVEALQRVFQKVASELPALFPLVGSAGMLCCRAIRLPSGAPGNTFSNHSWGTAVDLSISGVLDPRGNKKAQRGLLAMHPFFKAEKFFWGAGFSPAAFEDSMHFEASEELVRAWNASGQLD